MPTKSVKVEGVTALTAQLTRFANKARADTKNRVVVGYAAEYAGAVHEKTEMKLAGKPRPSGIGVYWGPAGEARFLSNALNENRDAIRKRIIRVTKNTHSLSRGLYSGGVLLKNLSKLRVPVEYGVLLESAFVKVVRK